MKIDDEGRDGNSGDRAAHYRKASPPEVNVGVADLRWNSALIELDAALPLPSHLFTSISLVR